MKPEGIKEKEFYFLSLKEVFSFFIRRII